MVLVLETWQLAPGQLMLRGSLLAYSSAYPTLPYPVGQGRRPAHLRRPVAVCPRAAPAGRDVRMPVMGACAAGELDAGRLPPRCTAARLTGAPGLQTHGILSDDPAANPTFHDWNHVAIWYCSSDSHLGDAPPGPAALRPARRRACCAAAAGVCLARAQPRACRRRCAPWPCADVDEWVCGAALVLYNLHSWMACHQLALRAWRRRLARRGHCSARAQAAQRCGLPNLSACHVRLIGAGAARRVAGWVSRRAMRAEGAALSAAVPAAAPGGASAARGCLAAREAAANASRGAAGGVRLQSAPRRPACPQPLQPLSSSRAARAHRARRVCKAAGSMGRPVTAVTRRLAGPDERHGGGARSATPARPYVTGPRDRAP